VRALSKYLLSWIDPVTHKVSSGAIDFAARIAAQTRDATLAREVDRVVASEGRLGNSLNSTAVSSAMLASMHAMMGDRATATREIAQTLNNLEISIGKLRDQELEPLAEAFAWLGEWSQGRDTARKCSTQASQMRTLGALIALGPASTGLAGLSVAPAFREELDKIYGESEPL
jgi:hypothetical protein